MKLKILAGAIALAASSVANALVVDATVNWFDLDSTGTQTGVSGSVAGGTVATRRSPVLTDIANQPTYGVLFSISPAAVIAGYTFSHTEWYVEAGAQAGGSASSNNVNGSQIRRISSSTQVDVGTTLGATDVFSLAATAGNAITSGIGQHIAQGASWDLITDTQTGNTAGYLNLGSALQIDAYLSANDTFVSDGNSDSVFSNFGNVGVKARYVYDQNQVPEPATTALLALALGGVAFGARRKA